MKPKKLWKSKTLWLNLLGAVATYGAILPVDPQIATYLLAGANIGVRLLTKGPVAVLRDAAEEP
jgi:hypothetical protein